jgi:hypothetical protein
VDQMDKLRTRQKMMQNELMKTNREFLSDLTDFIEQHTPSTLEGDHSNDATTADTMLSRLSDFISNCVTMTLMHDEVADEVAVAAITDLGSITLKHMINSGADTIDMIPQTYLWQLFNGYLEDL